MRTFDFKVTREIKTPAIFYDYTLPYLSWNKVNDPKITQINN